MSDREHGDNDERGKDEEEYPDATYLYIRTHPADDGSEPLDQALPSWQSPDIIVVKPGGAHGSEATADALNHVEVTVTNAGGMPATDAFVDVFVGNPSTSMTPVTTTLIGGSFLSIPALGTATIAFPWTPGQGDAGHRCLLARVSLVIPPDTYADPTVFDVRGDRHIAQRNIHVVALPAGQDSMSFSFLIRNPDPEREAVFLLQATEPNDPALRRGLIRSLGGLVSPRLADGELRGVSLQVHDLEREERPSLTRKQELVTGRLRRPLRPSGERELQLRLRPGEQQRATVTIHRNPDARPGEIGIVDIAQIDLSNEEPVGGLTIVAQHG